MKTREGREEKIELLRGFCEIRVFEFCHYFVIIVGAAVIISPSNINAPSHLSILISVTLLFHLSVRGVVYVGQ